MTLIQCEKGHFYDDIKHNRCPYCNKNDRDTDFEKTISKAVNLGEHISHMQLTQMYSDNCGDMDKTIGITSLGNGNRLVTGWLVVKEGKSRGKSFPLYIGKNTIGRSMKMDVALTDEEEVSRNNHFSVVFENKECVFYIVEGTAPVMINNKILKGYMKLREGDVISVSNVKLVFVPYCKKGRQWNEN